MTHSIGLEFFEQLPSYDHFQTILEQQPFQEIPPDWIVIVTDIVNSTVAIDQGQYKEINTVGACTIAAVVNALHKKLLPYVFGGDGATFCLPVDAYQTLKPVLRSCQQFAETAFDLKLRVGAVPYSQIRDQASIRICRYKKGPHLDQTIFVGGGLTLADQLIKTHQEFQLDTNIEPEVANFSGFECRWNAIPSPKEITVSLLVKPAEKDINLQLHVYQQLLIQLEQSLGQEDQYHPLTTKGLKLSFSPKKLLAEAKAKAKDFSQTRLKHFKTLRKLITENLIGWLLMQFNLRIGEADWGKYKKDFLENSDFRKLDDMYRTVFSCSQSEWMTLLKWLENQHQAGSLFYGFNIANAAIVTCLIEKAGEKHMHFVDGHNGGYALAAKSLKEQLAVG